MSIVAVNQCSGNSRSLFEPRVPGGQWTHGAVGNARWTGVRLADLLKKAGVKPGAMQISFQGLDRPVLPQTPAFIKALGMERANHPDTIVAYAMNDQPMPMLNGFPIRLVVPGWYATYWVKALNDITVLAEPFKGFWMDKAYRVPAKDPHARETPDKLATDTEPISAMTTRSLIVKPEDGQKLASGAPVEVQGVAIDDGSGIATVEVSTDGGKSWNPAKLDADLGKYSWRRWLSVDARRRRHVAHHGPRHQRQGSDAGNRAVELRSRCHRTHRRHHRVKGIAMKKMNARIVVIGSGAAGRLCGDGWYCRCWQLKPPSRLFQPCTAFRIPWWRRRIFPMARARIRSAPIA